MRNVRREKPRSLAGSLLVAHPNMLDPNFRRAVLFISAHDPEDGAIGVIINRPLDKSVADLVSETPPQNLADVPVFFGGPVGNNQLMLAAFEWHKGEGLTTFAQPGRSGGRSVRRRAFYSRVSGLCRMECWTTRGRDETKSVDCAKAQPFGVKIRAPVATLVRHHESARPLVSHACGRAGRSVAQLSDRFRMFYLVTGHSSLITC